MLIVRWKIAFPFLLKFITSTFREFSLTLSLSLFLLYCSFQKGGKDDVSVIGIRCNGYYLAEGLVSTSAFLHSWKWVSWALNLAQLSVGNFSRNWPAVSLLPARLGCSLKALQLAVLMTRYRITACQRTEAIAPTEREREIEWMQQLPQGSRLPLISFCHTWMSRTTSETRILKEGKSIYLLYLYLKRP